MSLRATYSYMLKTHFCLKRHTGGIRCLHSEEIHLSPERYKVIIGWQRIASLIERGWQDFALSMVLRFVYIRHFTQL